MPFIIVFVFTIYIWLYNCLAPFGNMSQLLRLPPDMSNWFSWRDSTSSWLAWDDVFYSCLHERFMRDNQLIAHRNCRRSTRDGPCFGVSFLRQYTTARGNLFWRWIDSLSQLVSAHKLADAIWGCILPWTGWKDRRWVFLRPKLRPSTFKLCYNPEYCLHPLQSPL